MYDVIENSFWQMATQIVDGLLVPVIALVIAMKLINSALFGGFRRD